jgi:hypothetical protein
VLGRHLAALALARPFLELAVTHVYWKTKGDASGYADYYQWLNGERKKPPFRNMLEWALTHLPSNSQVRGKRLDQLQGGLLEMYRRACAYHHTPAPNESVVTLGGGLTEATVYPFMLGLTQWMILLREVVHLFVLTYPMSLFPLPVHERCGFYPPVGVFADETTSAIVARFLSPNAVGELKRRLNGSEVVRERLDYFAQLPVRSTADLERAWQEYREQARIEDDVPDLPGRLTRVKSFSRAMGWTVNYLHGPQLNEDISDDAVDAGLSLLRDWRAD